MLLTITMFRCPFGGKYDGRAIVDEEQYQRTDQSAQSKQKWWQIVDHVFLQIQIKVCLVWIEFPS